MCLCHFSLSILEHHLGERREVNVDDVRPCVVVLVASIEDIHRRGVLPSVEQNLDVKCSKLRWI